MPFAQSDVSYNWGTMDAQQFHQTKRQGTLSIFGATLLATFAIAILLYGRMDSGQLILFAGVVLVVVGYIESQLASDQFNIHGIQADGAGMDVLVRYVFENDSKATIEKLHLDWCEIDNISADQISAVDGERIFGPRITLAIPLRLSKPVRVVSDLSFVDYMCCTKICCNALVGQLLQYRAQALVRPDSVTGVVTPV
jgi:hypothetical protein